jgi:acyl-CoA reductase-like NAD-dependent aldehyde dehydrogenase
MEAPFLKLKQQYPYFLANRPAQSKTFLPVTNKYSNEKICEVAIADPKAIQNAISAALDAFPKLKDFSHFRRKEVIGHCIKRFQERKEELARVLCLEVGKPIKDSRAEVSRLIDTFQIAYEEVGRLGGELTAMDTVQRGEGYQAFLKRFPIGPCSFISPFNFPLNLTAHKIAPALAVGCPFILKPASRTPLSALLLGEILAETDLPEGAFSILPCPREGAELFTTDERLKLLSFTGSPSVGWELKNKAGKKKVVLELGGNAACIVDDNANIEDAIKRILIGAFYQSGQSCISVQRIFIHHSIYQKFRDELVAAARKLKAGDPRNEETDIGPLISDSEAIRLEQWIQKAITNGATLLCGGKRKGAVLEPTLLENVSDSEPLCSEEAFGPVAVLSSFNNFSESLKAANDSRFGLQAGIFTNHLNHALEAWEKLEVGGVLINEIPSWRSDSMPYGGIKESGLGREGIRFAMEEMTEPKVMVIRKLD